MSRVLKCPECGGNVTELPCRLCAVKKTMAAMDIPKVEDGDGPRPKTKTFKGDITPDEISERAKRVKQDAIDDLKSEHPGMDSRRGARP